MSKSHKFQWPTMFSGLQEMTWADLPREISAGITLAALIIPLNIGYAQVAGLPPVFGLYAGIIPLAIFALFTSSRHVVGSPDAPISAILGAVLIGFAPIGDPLRVQYALALALMCGLLFFVFWLFRLAFLANFLSRAVLAGFITGLGIEVLTNQARRILGAAHIIDGSGLAAIAQQLHGAMATSVKTTGYFVELIALFESIPHANLYSVAIGLGAFVIVRLMKKYAPKAPAALIALILTTVIVAVFGLDQKGVKVLGAMPSGLPIPDAAECAAIRLFAPAARRHGGGCHHPVRGIAAGPQLQPKAQHQGGWQPGVVCLRHGQYRQRVHRFAGLGPQCLAHRGNGRRRVPHAALQPGGGRDGRAGHGFFYKGAGVPAHCGIGRGCRQCRVESD